MSGKYATPLHLEPGRSRRLAQLLFCIHGAALLALMFADMTVVTLFVLSSWVLVNLGITTSRFIFNTPIKSLSWLDNERWIIQNRFDKSIKGTLRGNVFIRPWLVIVYLKDVHGKPYNVLLLPDMLDSDTFRRLRVRLLIEINRTDKDGQK